MLTDALNARALLAPVMAQAFSQLQVSIALRADEEWYAIHGTPSISHPFEVELGVEKRRWPYNESCLERASRERKTVQGQHAGFFDLFVPVCEGSTVRGVLVTGPFALERPSSADVLERWRWLSGTQPHPSDPRFSEYLSRTLGTLTLEGTALARFQRLAECFAELLGGQGNVADLTRESFALGTELREVRFAEQMWERARSMINPRSAHIWGTRFHADALEDLGISQPPDYALVGLLLAQGEVSDPVDDIVRRDAFLRACVELARKAGVVCGRIGDHGVTFLASATGSLARRRAKLMELSERASVTARRWGFKLHFGLGIAETGSLAERYQAALAAAESALSQGLSVAQATPLQKQRKALLTSVRRELRKTAEAQPGQLGVLFDRYIETVVLECAHRLEPMRIQLEVGFEWVLDGLLRDGALEHALEQLQAELLRTSEEARTVLDLSSAYRRTIADIQQQLLRPQEARSERSMRQATAFIREHLAESLSLARVSRAAGFAPGYFSKLFKRREGVNLEQYIRQLRVTRARELLHDTTLSVERVARLAGFGKRSFHQVFKEVEGMTPLEYRDRTWWSGVSAHDRSKLRHARPKKRSKP